MTHHRRGLRRLLRDDDLAAAVEADWRTAPIPDRRRVMPESAVLLTRPPREVTEADIQALRTVGFSDRDILAIVEVTAYYAYANRVADGLGITTEPRIPDGS